MYGLGAQEFLLVGIVAWVLFLGPTPEETVRMVNRLTGTKAEELVQQTTTFALCCFMGLLAILAAYAFGPR